MNKPARLARNLSRFFGAIRIFISFLGIPAVLLWFVFSFLSPASGNGYFVPLFRDVRIEQSDDPTWKNDAPAGNHDFRLEKIKTDLKVNLRTSDRALSNAVRLTALPHFGAIMILAWIFVGQLRDLCARVEKGEIFTEENLKSLRNIGALYFAMAVIDCGFSLLQKIYVSPHLPVLPISGSNLHLQLDWHLSEYLSDFVTGFLILLLAEACRQGLALKKENDLTV